MKFLYTYNQCGEEVEDDWELDDMDYGVCNSCDYADDDYDYDDDYDDIGIIAIRTNRYYKFLNAKDNFSAGKIPEYQPPELVSITTEKPRETCIIKRVLNLFGCD